jgi:tetratricopeptide (TPR) repeat protein
MESKAEEKKNQGNNFFKQGNYLKAIQLYTEALGKLPSTLV